MECFSAVEGRNVRDGAGEHVSLENEQNAYAIAQKSV